MGTFGRFASASGQLTSVVIDDERDRTVTYTSLLDGRIVRRDEADNNGSLGDPHEIWYRYAGRELGYVGNNGTLDTDYRESIIARTRPSNPAAGPFRFGSTQSEAHSGFGPALDPYTSHGQGGAGGAWRVRAGDTLVPCQNPIPPCFRR